MRRVLQCKGQCIETRRGKCREMRRECAREAPALGTTFHSLALEGAGEFFIYGALIVICYTIWAVWVKLVALSP